MSWDSYIDSLISNSLGNVSQGCIIGLNGAIWTPAPPGSDKILAITQPEATAIGAIMTKKSGPAAAAHFPEKGIVVGGTKYMFLRDMDDDGKIITGKKTGVGNITMQSSNQAVVIGFCPDGKAAGQCNIAVDKIVKYLESAGF